MFQKLNISLVFAAIMLLVLVVPVAFAGGPNTITDTTTTAPVVTYTTSATTFTLTAQDSVPLPLNDAPSVDMVEIPAGKTAMIGVYDPNMPVMVNGTPITQDMEVSGTLVITGGLPGVGAMWSTGEEMAVEVTSYIGVSQLPKDIPATGGESNLLIAGLVLVGGFALALFVLRRKPRHAHSVVALLMALGVFVVSNNVSLAAPPPPAPEVLTTCVIQLVDTVDGDVLNLVCDPEITPSEDGMTYEEKVVAQLRGNVGSNGINCWDLNADRTFSADEDVNQDGAATGADCQGAQGMGFKQVGVRDGKLVFVWEDDTTTEMDFPLGPEGPQGAQGIEGQKGAEGRGIQFVEELPDEPGVVKITLTDGVEYKFALPEGPAGADAPLEWLWIVSGISIIAVLLSLGAIALALMKKSAE